jgi:hypothetical protein
MNTLFSGLSGNSFRKAFVAAAFIAAVLIAPAVSAQTITARDNVPSVAGSAGGFQAFVHPVENSVKMKVHFVNPQRNYVTIYVYNEDGDLAYKKLVGKEAVYHGTFDMSKLPDGEYSIKVSSRKGIYTQSLTLETQQKRFAMIQ